MMNEEPWLRTALLIALAALATAMLVSHAIDYPSAPSTWTSFTVTIAVAAISAVVRLLAGIIGMWRAGIERPSERLIAAAPAAMKEQTTIFAILAIVGLHLFAITFLKSMIPFVVPFWADDPLAAIDLALALNGEAIAHRLAPALPALGLFYGLWQLINLGGIVWVAHWQRQDRARFTLSYMLTWGIGMAVAYLCSSAGPLFTERYDLSIAPASVRLPAEMLWANYQSRGGMLGGGISAFPSLHVAIAAWFAAVLSHKGLRWLGIAYIAGIYACSIILGWHYAADGLGGLMVAWMADRLARRLSAWRWGPEQAPPLAVQGSG